MSGYQPPCRICGRPSKRRALCERHYEREMAHLGREWALRRLTVPELYEPDDEDVHDGICHCRRPDPIRIGGIWAGLDLYECTRCGRKLNRAQH